MRTTLDIDADVLELAKGLAHGRKASVGKVLSDLARRGARTPVQLLEQDGVYIIPKEIGGGRFGPDQVQAALDTESDEYLRYFRKRDAR